MRDYPKGLGILKEFIQNADDAEADEIVFVIDEQQYDVSGLPETMQWLHKAPAWLVYNNKPFSDNDIKGIQSIGRSGKADSIGKTGRFGIGFNASYNVTDVPYFFTRDKLYFFDPHCETLPEASTENPGGCLSIDKLLISNWPLVDSFSHFISKGERFVGTAFRLPFRSEQQARTSKICNEVYTVTDALGAVRELQKMGSAILLFLKHLRRLKIDHRQSDGSLITLLSIEATNSEEITESRSEVNHHLRSSNPEQILSTLSDNENIYSSCRHEYCVEIKGAQHTDNWLVVDGFFTDEEHKVISACRKMIENKQKALPYAGVAWPLDCDDYSGGSLFCFLPLSLKTSLPAKINGYFDLDRSRQNIFHDESTQGVAHSRFDWNKTLLETSIAQAYVQLLEDLRSDLGTYKINSYYDAFPKAVDNPDSLEGWFTSAFYEQASGAELFRCSGDTTWCELSATRTLPSDLLTVGNALIADDFLQIPNPALPLHVRQGFTFNEIDVPELTPHELRSRLKEQHDVECPINAAPRACLRNREYITQILSFCISYDPEVDISGLPLAIDCRGHLRTLGFTDSPLYLEGSLFDRNVFIDHPEWFVDSKFAEELDLREVEEVDLLKMDSERFVCELASFVSTLMEDIAPKFIKERSGAFTDNWLKAVFNRLLVSELDGIDSALQKIPLIPDQYCTLHPMGSSATPLLFDGLKCEGLKQALLDLFVPLVFPEISRELRDLLNKFSELTEDYIWPVTPGDLIDTLATECKEKLQEYDKLTNVQQSLLRYLSRDESLAEISKMPDRQKLLKSLKLFPTAKGTLFDLSETVYVSDFRFPSIDFDVVLLDDGPTDQRWRELYLLLGAYKLSQSRFITEFLLPSFADLDANSRITALEWLRNNFDSAQSDDENKDSDDLFEEVVDTAIIFCEDGQLRKPKNVYQPGSELASQVFGDRAAFPDMNTTYFHDQKRWLGFFRLLNMPIEPRLPDVVEHVRTLIDDENDGDKVERLKAVYIFIKGLVDTEIQNQKEISVDLSAALEELADLPWVPIRQDAGNLLCFTQPEDAYGRPCDIYFSRVGQLIASQAYITVLLPEPKKREGKAMGFPIEPSVDQVAAHFRKILALYTAKETQPKDEVPVSAIKQIYRFFGGATPYEEDELDEEARDQESGDTERLGDSFSKIPCIWDQEQKKFWRPDHVFADNVRYMEPWRHSIRFSEEAIERGYTALGRKQEPTIEVWKQVLEEISQHIRKLSSEELSGVVREVIRRIVEELINIEEVDSEVLVPTHDGRLLEAKDVFMADAPWYEALLESWDIPILSRYVAGIYGIQRVLTIPSLAASIEQRLTEVPDESDLAEECQECSRLENLLRSSEFILGLQRLLRHEEHEVSEESLFYLRGIHVRCVKVIRTTLFLQTYSTKRLLGDYKAEFYWDHETLEAMLAEDRRSYFCDDLAELLNRTLDDRPLQNLAPLVRLLQHEPHEISEVLDHLKIRQFAFDFEESPEAEDEVTPQEFPDDDFPDDAEEAYEKVEPEESEGSGVDTYDDAEREEELSENAPAPQPESAGGDHDLRPSEGSTATRPRHDETGHPDQHSLGKNADNTQERQDTTENTGIGNGIGKDHPDMEKDVPFDGAGGSTQESTTSRPTPKTQSRLKSYVSHEDNKKNREHAQSQNDSQRILIDKIDKGAVDFVIEQERKEGRKARSMAHKNAGYDVISESEDTTRYIEVKGTGAAWGERGVELSRTQFLYKQKKPDRDYWLYVVENVLSGKPRIHKIQNPSSMVDSFCFDGGWSQVAESVEVSRVEMKIPSPGDEVLENDQVVGYVKSVRSYGELGQRVIYQDLAGSEHSKWLSEITIRAKDS